MTPNKLIEAVETIGEDPEVSRRELLGLNGRDDEEQDESSTPVRGSNTPTERVRLPGRAALFVSVTLVIGIAIISLLAMSGSVVADVADGNESIDPEGSVDPGSEADTEHDWFNIEPRTSIHTPYTTVTEDQEAIVEVSISNPSLNDQPVEAEISGSYPSGMSIAGENLGNAGGGQFTGSVTIAPGSERTITIRLAPNELSDFTVDGVFMYTHADTDRIDQTNLQRPFSVEVDDTENLPEINDESSNSSQDNEGGDTENPDDQNTNDGNSGESDRNETEFFNQIGSPAAGLIGLVAVIFMGIAIVGYHRQD